jgi:hypothetical protein
MKITHDSNRHVIIVPLAVLIHHSLPNYRLATLDFTDNITATTLLSRRSGVRIPARKERFFLLEIVQTGSGANPVSFSMGTRVPSRA